MLIMASHTRMELYGANEVQRSLRPNEWLVRRRYPVTSSVNPRNQPIAHTARIVAIARQLVLQASVLRHRSYHRDD